MDEKWALQIANTIFENIFGKPTNLTLEQIRELFAFDEKLPKSVRDSVTGEETWADSINGEFFITQKNMEERDMKEGWLLPKREVSNLNDILEIWKTVNYTTTERVYDSINVAQSDTIYNCENIFRSSDCRECKNVVFSDSCTSCEYILACSRSGSCTFGIRVDDSGSCTNSYNVTCSSKISNSIFIQDCFNLNECMFCSHIANKNFCIANMQFEEEEYYEIKRQIVDWILSFSE